jgi:integrase
MRGRPLKEIQELLGHRDFKMTLRYAHLSPGRLREAVASLRGLQHRVNTQRPEAAAEVDATQVSP